MLTWAWCSSLAVFLLGYLSFALGAVLSINGRTRSGRHAVRFAFRAILLGATGTFAGAIWWIGARINGS